MSALGVRTLTAVLALASLARRRVPSRAPLHRILVAHYLLLGDTILLAPLLKRLAAAFPDAELVVLVRPAVEVLFSGRPYGVRTLVLDRRDPRTQRRVIASGPYDLAIVPDDNRYAWLARAAGARRVIGFAGDRPSWKNWMLDEAVPYPDRPGAWADLVAHCLGGRVVPTSVEVTPFARGEWPAPPAAAFDHPAADYAVLHVGASTPLKQWEGARWRALADTLRADGLTIVWSGGTAERDLLDAVGVRSGEQDAVGRFDLAQLFALLARATLVVCPDTGIAHLARLTGVPTVALFGPGSRVLHGPGAFWAGTPFEVATVDDFPCRDQTTLYRREVGWVRRCGRRFDAAAAPAGGSDAGACGRALCMEAIGETTVAAALARLP